MRKNRNVIQNVVKNLKSLFFIIIIGVLTACNVHEWPELPEQVSFHLKLKYETDMTEWHHFFDGSSIVEIGYGDTYDNHQEYGQIRYIVRAYPLSEKQRATSDYRHEFVFTKNIGDGYDHEVTLDLPAGNYTLMVWSDLVKYSADTPFYQAANFAEITLRGEHQANTDHRDAFKGSGNIQLVADIVEHIPETYEIVMQRPLAKYEFVTTDLLEFINKEYEFLLKEAASRGETPPTRVNTDDYEVVLYYSGYMPNAYNMNTDKPVDSMMGILYDSALNVLNENEASLGFDYVFVGNYKSAVTIQIGLYDKEGRQVALTNPLNIPLQRTHHTILKGSFLMQDASGGIVIDPEFDGDINIEIE